MSSAEISSNACGDAEIIQAAKSELRRFRNGSALTLLDGLKHRDRSHKRTAAQLRMRALVNQRRFEDAIVYYESLSSSIESDVRSFSLYIEACIAAGQSSQARAELERVVFLGGKNSPEILAKLYRYSSVLDGAYRSLFDERLLAVAGSLRSRMKSLVHLAHNLAHREDWRGFSQAAAAMETFDLNVSEKARLALLRAQVAHQLGDAAQYLDQFNEALRRLKLQPVCLVKPRRGFLLDNLTAEVAPSGGSNTLVSVLMTAFNSESTIGYAINSVLNQSHKNLELLVVDDRSEDRTRQLVMQMAARDSRLIPIFSERNAGTYACKNVALGRARGEYVTCQDSDDWAHPQKIETCVSRLNETDSLVATGVQHVRLSPEHGIQFRFDYMRPDVSSLMYRAEPVRRSLGFYDSVRAAADTEFQRRIELTFGLDAVRYGEELLSLMSWRKDTLTGGGAFALGHDNRAIAPPREAYRREFVRWHEEADDLYIDFPLKKRPFPAPEEILS